MKKWIFLTLALLAVPLTANAAKIKLGEVSLMDRKDRDVINLGPCKTTSNRRVNKLQLVVTRYAAEIDKLKVIYHNNEQQLLSVRDIFKAGTTSRWIDLNGPARCIKQIIVLGDAQTRRRNNRKQAHVAFWGTVPEAPKEVVAVKPVVTHPTGAKPVAAGTKLGQVRLTDAKDRDVISLPACKDSSNFKVNKIRLKVMEHPVEIDRFKVVYHNNEEQLLSVKDQFKANTVSRWIDLNGPARCIAKIIIIGDTQSIGRRPGKQGLVIAQGLKLAAAAASPAPVHAKGVILGQVTLTDAKDRDVINLAPCKSSSNIPVRSIKLHVNRFQAQVDRLRVIYQNGQDQFLDVRKTFQPGSQSRWIDLNGDARCVDKIIIIGDTNTLGRRPGKQASVVFHGK
jgi:hypothetical protein